MLRRMAAYLLAAAWALALADWAAMERTSFGLWVLEGAAEENPILQLGEDGGNCG